MPDVEFVQITSVGYSGSTLLDMILGAHPQAQSVGEVWSLHQKMLPEHEICSCGEHLTRCPFWSDVCAELERATGAPRDALGEVAPLRAGALKSRHGRPVLTLTDLILLLGSRRLMLAASKVLPWLRESVQAARNNLQVLETVQRKTGARAIIDSSKNPIRLKLLYLVDPERIKWIQLVRDGRGVALSWRKHGSSPDMRHAARNWYRRDQLINYMNWNIPRDKRMLVRYEDICRDPEKTVAGICEFIGLEFDPVMLQFREGSGHNVRGNPMSKRANEREIHLDEKWRKEWSADDLALFEKIAGRWNRRYGYDH